MNSRELAGSLADRIIKGLTVTGFENDADAAQVLEGQREAIEGTIFKVIAEMEKAHGVTDVVVQKLMKAVPVYGVIKSGESIRNLLDYYIGVLAALELAEQKMSNSPEFNAWDLGPSPTLIAVRRALGKPTGEKK